MATMGLIYLKKGANPNPQGKTATGEHGIFCIFALVVLR